MVLQVAPSSSILPTFEPLVVLLFLLPRRRCEFLLHIFESARSFHSNVQYSYILFLQSIPIATFAIRYQRAMKIMSFHATMLLDILK